jgi:hypothetical protein
MHGHSEKLLADIQCQLVAITVSGGEDDNYYYYHS